MRFRRITVDPTLMGGAPCIRGLRIPVATVVGMIADGMAEDEILRGYPDLELDDIREALRYAAAGCGGRWRRNANGLLRGVCNLGKD
jgi:uncharacterized protein (DUF433 family)